MQAGNAGKVSGLGAAVSRHGRWPAGLPSERSGTPEAAALLGESGQGLAGGRILAGLGRGEEGALVLRDLEGGINGGAAVEGISPLDGADGPQQAGMLREQLLKDEAAAAVVVRLLGGEDGGNEDDVHLNF